MTDDIDFFTYHRAASNKLKKRFLKKPNIAEASEEFDRLKNHLARIECYPYAAFIALSKAKCEQGLLNTPGEIDSLVEAGRFFLKADREIEEVRCPNFEENLENAVQCFTYAIGICKNHDMKPMAGTLSLEIAEVYFQSKHFSLATPHYKNAVECFNGVPSQVLSASDKLLHCQLLEHDYYSALETSMSMVDMIKDQGSFNMNDVTPLGFYFDLYKKTEVTRVLLLMYLRPSINFKTKYEAVLHDYNWPDEAKLATSSHFLDKLLGEDLYVYLRSLVMACKWNDSKAVRTVQSDVMHILTHGQNEILGRIIHDMR